MIDFALRSSARVLRRAVRTFLSDDPEPSVFRQVAVLGGFVPAFGLWMGLRQVLMATRRNVHVEATTTEGHKLACPLPDMIPMYLYLFGVWEPDLTAYLKRSLGPGDVLVDVGANHGAFALLGSGLVGPKGQVVAVEALPSMAEKLRANLERNGATGDNGRLGPVTVIVAAASDRETTLSMYEGPFENAGRTTTLAERGEREAATVRAAPLPDLVDESALRRARIIKIDVEGAEPAVLRGLAQALPILHPDAEILLELSPHWWRPGDGGDDADRRSIPDAASVLAPFLAAGYRAYELPNDYWPWRYAFPKRVGVPKPLHEPLETLRRRVDLVLSRRDQPQL